MHFAFIFVEYIMFSEYITITSAEEGLDVCDHNFSQEIETESSVTSEAVAWRCSTKKVFLEILQNSQANTRARASFLITLLKKRLWQRYFSVNFAKFLRTPFPVTAFVICNLPVQLRFTQVNFLHAEYGI